MRLGSVFGFALFLVCAASGQVSEEELRSKIKAVRYPILARIQGHVRLRVKAGAATPLFGHPLLAHSAVESARVLGPIQGRTDFDLTYHFVLVDHPMTPTPVTVPRGNAFQRSLLRVFGRKTHKIVLEDRCQEGVPPPHEIKIAGTVIEITIFGRSRCLQAQALLASAER